jgi:hypothetical protein
MTKRAHRNNQLFGIARTAEVQLDERTMRDLQDMYHQYPVFKIARTSFLSMAIPEPFTYSIPKLGIDSGADMEGIIRARWMPWLRTVYDWCRLYGLCPYYFKNKNSDHPIPVTPDFEKGYITVEVDEQHDTIYKWYWNHGTTTQIERDMLWIFTEDKPACDGSIRSRLRSLLDDYRALCKLQKNRNIAATQRARPVHVIEVSGDPRSAPDDNLAGLTADFGKAAGIGKARRELAHTAQIERSHALLRKQMRDAQTYNTANSKVRPTMWTDTPDALLEEQDAGFDNNVVVLRPGFSYREAAKPDLIGDYEAAATHFNIQASALMDFSLEMLTPTGSSRTQNAESAARFENDRIKDQNSFFTAVIQQALVIAYRKLFQDIMDHNARWRLSRLHGDPSMIPLLFPELDVIVNMSASSVLGDEELRSMRNDGIMTQETMGKRMFKNKGLPDEERVALAWPDNVDRELLLGREKEPVEKKPVKKKPKKKKKVE